VRRRAKGVEAVWAEESQHRLAEVNAGIETPIPGRKPDEVPWVGYKPRDE
jgi:hypothetical protein